MKRLACFLMSVVLILGLMATACAEAPDMSVLSGLTVGFSQCDNGNSWRVAETNSMKEVAAKYGINCIITDAGGDIAKQASDIQDLIAQGVSYLVVAPQQEDGLQASIADAWTRTFRSS
jgi:ABC-type sugar transport system substrate-binding protein